MKEFAEIAKTITAREWIEACALFGTLAIVTVIVLLIA